MTNENGIAGSFHIAEGTDVIQAEFVERSVAGDAFVSTGGSSSLPLVDKNSARFSWSDPPRRGGRELLIAFGVSPQARAIVQRVLDAYGAVDWFVPGDNNEKDFTHPMVKLLDNYNPHLIGSQGRELEQAYLETNGEAITIIAPGPGGDSPIELYPVPPPTVTPEIVNGKQQFRVNTRSGQVVFPAEMVLYQRNPDWSNPYGRGLGLAASLGDEIETDEYVAKHAKAYYYNSAVPEFIGILQGTKTKADLDKFRADWDAQYSGFRRHYRAAWLNQVVDIKELTRRLGTNEIERLRRLLFKIMKLVWGIPPEILGDVENSNRATAQAAIDIMARMVTTPRCKRRRAFWNKNLAPFFGGVQVDYVSPIPLDFGRRDQIMERHQFHFKRNEIRAEAGLDPVPEAENIYMVPLNMAPSDSALLLDAPATQLGGEGLTQPDEDIRIRVLSFDDPELEDVAG